MFECVLRKEDRGVWVRLLMCGVRTYLNLSQLLPILGTQAKYVQENTLGTSFFLAVFRVCTAADSASASCISGFRTDVGTASALLVFRPLVLIVLVLRVLAVPKYSRYAQ